MRAEKNDFDGQLNIFDVVAADDGKNKAGVQKESAKKTGKSKKNSENASEDEIEEKKEKPDFWPIHKKADEMKEVMHKIFEDMLEKEKIVVAYIDYNVIYYKDRDKKAQLLQFKNAKLAVDRYMDIVDRLRNDEMLIEDEGELVLTDV